MADLIFQTEGNEQDRIVESGAFWSKLNLKELRGRAGISQAVPDERLEHLVMGAVLFVNRQLKDFRIEAERNGFKTLAETSSETINQQSVNECHYLDAVCAYVKASVLESYADYDATDKTAGRAEAKLRQSADFKRNGYISICHILERQAVDSELI